ncbi:MAG: LacI family DNA-binding transcriptional regulator [Armatimonadetes bacterium]|nr:LacI family DNA-binding transcriptional regulator [Armatimonadota bacterium]
MRKPTTLKDVAGALGMHKSTVSLALSGKGTISAETRKRVSQVAKELGYEPNVLAQRLAGGVETTTVSILSGVLDVGLATEKILLIQQELSAHGFEVPLYTWHSYSASKENSERQAAQVRNLCRQRPRAIVCAVQRLPNAILQELDAYQARGGVVISYDIEVPYEWDQIVFDREDNAYRAAKYLLEAGHRKLGLGMSHLREPVSPTDPQAHRLQGFQRALAEYDVPFRPEWLFHTSTYERGGVELAKQFLVLRDRPTALAVVNDYMAMALMNELTQAGVRLPDDLSLIGHDNQPIATYCPVPLTTLTQPTEKIAQAVVAQLRKRLEERELPPQRISIESELVERQSVTRPKEN